MGRRNPYREPELQSVPKISYRTKKLASASRKRKVDGRSKPKNQQNHPGNFISIATDSSSYDKSVPNYMQDTIARRESLVLPPLRRLEIAKKLYAASLTFSPSSGSPPGNNSPSERRQSNSKISGLSFPKVSDNLSLTSSLHSKNSPAAAAHDRIMARAAAIATTTTNGSRKSSFQFADENPFTFQPKVSSASVRIVEGLGSDFMTRQQQHIEKQKKNLEQANQHYQEQIRVKKSTSPTEKTNTKRSESFDAGSENKDAMKPQASQSNTSVNNNKSTSSKTVSNQGLSRLENSPYGSLGVGAGPGTVLAKQKTKIAANLKKRQNTTIVDSSRTQRDEHPEHISHNRSKTLPPGGQKTTMSKVTEMNLDRVKNAKLMAERAIRKRKVFTIQGPYPSIRASLRRRGWVEKFYKIPGPVKKIQRSVNRKPKIVDSDDDNDDDDGDDDGDADDYMADENKVPPWEENDGIYGIMSRIARNSSPTFVWCIRRDAVDFRFMSRDQMVNHYCRAGSFTTKAGLCTNIRNVQWYYDADPDTFFPRSYKLNSEDDDKLNFVDDYRLSACMNIIKWVIYRHEGEPEPDEGEDEEKGENEDKEEKLEENTSNMSNTSNTSNAPNNKSPSRRKKKGGVVPMKCLDVAIQQCERWIRFKNNEDIDHWEDPYEISDAQWDQLIQWSYQLTQDDGVIQQSRSRLAECQIMADRLRLTKPQFDMDGTKNIWIVKPGAQSRGRGIMVMGKLDEILKLVNTKKYVVQKYIERPLLIYNTKFDIRQWFLVTDWNPLTMWFYQDCYFRFCTQQFTLDDYNASIHLCNNSIQKHYSNGPRSSHLPQDNMWDNDQFKDYLRRRGHGDVWDKVIYPGMKEAVLSALLCTQDLVEYRKSSFELYGADFMITEDFRPWLIEINCSPTMAPSTKVTSRLCANVQEDTIKVVIDRKYDKTADVGRFELAYKQSVVDVPPYIGLCLSVEGQGIRKPGSILTARRNTCASLDIVAEVNQNQTKESKVNRSSPYLASSGAAAALEQTYSNNKPLPFSYTKPTNHYKSPTLSSSLSSTTLGKKDSVNSVTSKSSSSAATTVKNATSSSSMVAATGSRSRDNNIVQQQTTARQLPERERFPLRLTNVDALDLKQALAPPSKGKTKSSPGYRKHTIDDLKAAHVIKVPLPKKLSFGKLPIIKTQIL
ncbi:tubulin tyrosine ligase 3-like isoform X2 [Tubulanus polymorphus]|uniref:tubulin tyrosine ligase 3-like isoform X2 n=1 Tax=Tubulanus polymorphus TaxID=672921 RepID=UPI003DA2950A